MAVIAFGPRASPVGSSRGCLEYPSTERRQECRLGGLSFVLGRYWLWRWLRASLEGLVMEQVLLSRVCKLMAEWGSLCEDRV